VKLALLAVAPLLWVHALEAALIMGLVNTGVDASGDVGSAGEPELHYSLSGPISGAAILQRHLSSANHTWIAAPPGSAWIGPTDGPIGPQGVYKYTLQFNLAGLDPSAVLIKGEYASDNTAQIFLNGSFTGCANRGKQYHALTTFAIGKGLVAGRNTLEFRITNGPPAGPNPTGLLVARLSLACDLAQRPVAPSEALAASLSVSPEIFQTSTTAVLPCDPAFRFALPGDVRLSHWIESSPDLVHWSVSTNLNFYFKDPQSTNHDHFFYRFRPK